MHDHLGFGFSPRPKDASYSLKDQASRAIAVWELLRIERAHLVAHDYGTSVATELLARRERGELPVELQSVTLCNGSVHIELATMSLIQKLVPMPIVADVLARLASYRLFAKQMRRITADGLLAEQEIEAMWELQTRDGGGEVLPKIARYVAERREHCPPLDSGYPKIRRCTRHSGVHRVGTRSASMTGVALLEAP